VGSFSYWFLIVDGQVFFHDLYFIVFVKRYSLNKAKAFQVDFAIGMENYLALLRGSLYWREPNIQPLIHQSWVVALFKKHTLYKAKDFHLAWVISSIEGQPLLEGTQHQHSAQHAQDHGKKRKEASVVDAVEDWLLGLVGLYSGVGIN
jgi:hypothetical protein